MWKVPRVFFMLRNLYEHSVKKQAFPPNFLLIFCKRTRSTDSQDICPEYSETTVPVNRKFPH